MQALLQLGLLEAHPGALRPPLQHGTMYAVMSLSFERVSFKRGDSDGKDCYEEKVVQSDFSLRTDRWLQSND